MPVAGVIVHAVPVCRCGRAVYVESVPGEPDRYRYAYITPREHRYIADMRLPAVVARAYLGLTDQGAAA